MDNYIKIGWHTNRQSPFTTLVQRVKNTLWITSLDLQAIYGTTRGKQIAVLRSFLLGMLSIATFFLVVGLIRFDALQIGSCSADAAFAIFSLWLVKKHKAKLAAILTLTFLNAMAYVTISSEQFETGFHLYFLLVGFMALLVFDFSEKKYMLFFFSCSTAAFIVSALNIYSPLPMRTYSDEANLAILIVNTIIFVVAGSFLFKVAIDINQAIEMSILQSNQQYYDQNKKLTKTHTSRDEFLFSVINYFQAPLRTIKGLITRASIDEPHHSDAYLGKIKEQSEQMDLIIRQILNYSQSVNTKVEASDIRLRNLVETCIAELPVGMLGNKQDHVGIRIRIDDRIRLVSDYNRLRLAIDSLLINAIQYSDLAKAEPFVELAATRASSGIELKIADNGIGIPEDAKTHVFDPFFKVSEQSTGHGLGLYVTREALSKIGGEISVESKESAGSTFVVKLPMIIASSS